MGNIIIFIKYYEYYLGYYEILLMIYTHISISPLLCIIETIRGPSYTHQTV